MFRLSRAALYTGAGLIFFLTGAVSQGSGAIDIPADTRLSVRLQSALSSRQAVPNQTVSGLLIAPIRVNGQDVLPSGFVVTGSVLEPSEAHKRLNHSVLCLSFGEMTGNSKKPLAFRARVSSVDNGRESVDAEGVIHGLRPLRRQPSEIEDILMLAAYAHPVALASLEAGRFIVAEEEKPRVTFEPGVELWLSLLDPIRMANVPEPRFVREPAVLRNTRQLSTMINNLPLRTSTRTGAPSDLINCAFLGTEQSLTAAFKEAGWLPADKLDVKTEVQTFFAVAYRHSFREGPVSSLVVDGQNPALVFEKETNTFSKRHHIRIWATKQSYSGQPVWIGAATHDISIVFSRKARTFSHSVEPDIDDERQKILDDLIFTGQVNASALINRATAPQTFQNATGDHLQTDGRLAVLKLKP